MPPGDQPKRDNLRAQPADDVIAAHLAVIDLQILTKQGEIELLEAQKTALQSIQDGDAPSV